MENIRNIARELWRQKVTGMCAICQLPADTGRVCEPCRQVLPWNETACECCGQPLLAGQPPGVSCEACQAKRPPFIKARAPLVYEFPVDAVIKAIKFKRQIAFAPAFTELLLETLESEFAEVDALLPVPLHHWRQMTRGFNQATELARPLAKHTGLPLAMQARRVRATPAQTGLTAGQRRKNLKGAFAIRGRLKCRHPLIIDDVITTGETCSQLTVALLESGAQSVSVLTVARATVNRKRRD